MKRQLRRVAFFGIGIFLLAGCAPQPQAVSEAAEAALDASLCVEMIHGNLSLSVVVEHAEDGTVNRTAYIDGSCEELGGEIVIEWRDYLGLFPLRSKGYYPRKLPELGTTWSWTELQYHYESPDFEKAMQRMLNGDRVQFTMSSEFNMETNQCWGSGEPCEHETDHDDYNFGPIDFEISEKKMLSIGGKDYEVWVIEWSSGKIIYSPLLRIPLQTYYYRNILKDPELYLVNEVVAIRGLETPSHSDGQ